MRNTANGGAAVQWAGMGEEYSSCGRSGFSAGSPSSHGRRWCSTSAERHEEEPLSLRPWPCLFCLPAPCALPDDRLSARGGVRGRATQRYIQMGRGYSAAVLPAVAAGLPHTGTAEADGTN